MARRLKPLSRLAGDQLRASSPRDHATLSASAGTGKTHVLTARVLRLLLSGVDPASILCLTFTKAGAAEMADRIHARLAYWVRLKNADLAAELAALGEDVGPDMCKMARTLFARVLDASGGGLRIQTIHAFAQSLLASFPAEAGLAPGFSPLEKREEQHLVRQTLVDLLVRAEVDGDLSLIGDLQSLSHRMGEGGAEDFLKRCARAPDAMAALGPRQGIEARLRRAFDIPSGDIEEKIAAACHDDAFDMVALGYVEEANRLWGAAKGAARCETIAAWRAGDGLHRAKTFHNLARVVLKKDGEPLVIDKGLIKVAPDYADHAALLAKYCRNLLDMQKLGRWISVLAAGLRAGQSFAAAYAAAKRVQGLVDFDDLIRWAEQLLLQPGMGDWVRYKLDQATDHILVDEAQDTSERQWNIVRALTLEYFAGEGASAHHRTIFAVGDYKQAIFGFQGTDPESFRVARAWFSREANAVDRDFLDLSMDRSFRSSPPVLELVDRVIAGLGHETLGLQRRPNPHETAHTGRPGSVVLWQPFSEEAPGDEDLGEEGWISDTKRRYAARLARQIRHWIDHPFEVAGKEKGQRRPVRPEDILILVQKRGDLASLIVARLYAEGVPVAGVDRLLLSAPLAVHDLLAAARFAVQPLDDLNLASLLVSPLFGWSQEDLFAIANQRKGSLWSTLRHHRASFGSLPATNGDASANIRETSVFDETIENLLSILAMADYATPYGFFETILSGPMDGRRKILQRLGAEARDPVEELLASALEFETTARPSLQQFLDWFARGDVEIVRDPSVSADMVRVMTVHGSKGLQSPVVILADACRDPARPRETFANFRAFTEGPEIPVFRPRKDELFDPLQSQIEAQNAARMQEHWRLLYVALTRAEERLYIGGALGASDRNGPPESSWYKAIDRPMEGMGAEWGDDAIWGRSRRFGDAEIPVLEAVSRRAENSVILPPWLGQPAPAEARPSRPLAPSSLGDDTVANPPPSPALRDAALRGKLLHQLFERLPGSPGSRRTEYADHWLEKSAGVTDPALRSALVEDALKVIADPVYADLFGPAALAEAPIAAVLANGVVVAGTVDRLLVTDDRIFVVDFKTGRIPPASIDEIPEAHLRQMSAYVAALRIIFPDYEKIEAALLYTSEPVLHVLPETLLGRIMGPDPNMTG